MMILMRYGATRYIMMGFKFDEQYTVHSPYDLPVETMSFTDMMKQDEIEAMYAVVETV